jgi:tetratricopeptide (TPR) repeat protein
MGRTEEALAMLVAARDEAVRRGDDLPREQLAWFHLRVGDVLARSGRVEEAEAAYGAGLAAHPGDYRIAAAMAKLAMGRWHWPKAVEYALRAVEGTATPDPATLVLLGDAYTGLGDKAKAAEAYQEAERNSLAHPELYNRAWTTFLIEHDGEPARLAKVVGVLKQEIQSRRDIYGYDLLAWALYRQGNNAEAREMAQMALRTGARDATIYFHAGMIEHALGSRDAARRYLEQALATNPYFHPTYPALARTVLVSLGAPLG